MIAMPDPAPSRCCRGAPRSRASGGCSATSSRPSARPTRATRATSCAARSSARTRWASTPSTSGPSSSTSCSATASGTEPLDSGGYFDLTTLDAGSDVRRETSIALEALGIHVEYSHHEVGPSQHEIDIRYADALKMADDCMTYRITVKEFALKYGWHATFMPKPIFGENGSGMHTHQSLFAKAATPSSTPTTTTSSRPSARRSSPASSATRARSARSSPSGSTPTSASCRATRRRSTSPGRGATARRSCACRSITPARRRRRAWSCAARTRPATPT